MRNLTIFVEEYDGDRSLKGIYIKEKIGNNEYKITLAGKGRLIGKNDKLTFELSDGSITNISKNGSFKDLKKLHMIFQTLSLGLEK